MLKLAEAYMTKTREESPERYYDKLPLLCRYLVDMILGERYVLSADFLAREYWFDRLSAEKMWRMISCPEMTTFADVAPAVFTGFNLRSPVASEVTLILLWTRKKEQKQNSMEQCSILR